MRIPRVYPAFSCFSCLVRLVRLRFKVKHSKAIPVKLSWGQPLVLPLCGLASLEGSAVLCKARSCCMTFSDLFRPFDAHVGFQRTWPFTSFTLFTFFLKIDRFRGSVKEAPSCTGQGRFFQTPCSAFVSRWHHGSEEPRLWLPYPCCFAVVLTGTSSGSANAPTLAGRCRHTAKFETSTSDKFNGTHASPTYQEGGRLKAKLKQ